MGTPGKKRAGGLGSENLHFFNGIGGFSANGREYVIRIRHNEDNEAELPPQPWINVIANERFGFLFSDEGAGFTWSGNSREHRLTPWCNDPVTDPHDEALYIRDEETGVFWSPLPGPAPAAADYEVRHGFGYSSCRHSSNGIDQETLFFAPRSDPVKIIRLRLENRGVESRRLSLFNYQRLVLGTLPGEGGRFVQTEVDSESGALLARNRMSGEFAGHVVFAAVVGSIDRESVHVSGNRTAFIGRNRTAKSPRALECAGKLERQTGAGIDPCFAQQVEVKIDAGASLEIDFLLGEGRDLEEARALIDRYTTVTTIAESLAEVREFWLDTVSGIQVETPSPALDLMVNGWLVYQVVACRIWGRSALYQSGGAFGYRDQLQDTGALVTVWPDLLRRQILLHAAHQFVEGDVLHWWHPPANRGIRTRFADDLLWLPYMTADYVQTTGDWDVLDEEIPFLTGPTLEEGEDEGYLQAARSGESADLYEHCCRAIDRSLTEGSHGLPLFGAGDWNDAMNRVGREGRGESVWMGFFLYAILGEFFPICERRGERNRADRYRAYREKLFSALNEAGWDGEWYRRGYYDDGAPLGSKQGDECRIDALAQSWAVLSRAAPKARAVRAFDAVEKHLVLEDPGLIRLLTPPFDKTSKDPGYIKGYAPGVRENGGQYTHAALWVVRAAAELGMNQRAAILLEMLNPINHARDPEGVSRYRIEPYVVAADVYGEPPHTGRGGWSWYTGSAGWMYRVAIESILGLRLIGGDNLIIKPCIPDDWPRFEINYRLPGEQTRYEILVTNPSRSSRSIVGAEIDGEPAQIDDGAVRVPLSRDGKLHRVTVVLGLKRADPPR
jgi:cyclic beta-1,2-glucan synthetase